MSGVYFSASAKPPLQVGRWTRNGFIPAAELQKQLAELAAYSAQVRSKVVFRSVGGIANIPNSASGDRSRWRFAWHSGPYARLLFVHFVMARQNNGTPTSPYARLRVTKADGSILGDARAQYGSASGALDVPGFFGVIETALVEHDNEDNVLVELEPDTDYFAEFSEHDYARIQSATVFEVALEPDTDNGYPSTGAVGGAPILRGDRGDVATMLRALWNRGGAHLANWASDLDADAPTFASSTFTNIVDETSTSVSGFTPGFVLDLRARDRDRDADAVPVIMKVYADGTAGEVRLLDSNGDTALSVTVDNGEGWYAVQGTLPNTEAKYDLHAAASSGSLTVFGVSLWQCDTFEPWAPVVYGELAAPIGNVTLSADADVEVQGQLSQSIGTIAPTAAGTVTDPYSLLYNLVWSTGSVTEGDTNSLLTFADVGGATQTGLTLTVVVGPIDPDGAIEDSPAPTVTNLNGWTLSTSGSTLGFSGDPGTYYYQFVFTRASLGVGSHSGPVIEVDTIEPGTAYVWFDGTNGSSEVPSPSGGGNGSSFTILAAPVFDALVTTPTHLSTHDLDISTPSNTPLPCTVTATASGQNQTSGYVKVDVYDSYGAGGLIDSISTTDAAGWTQTSAWALDGMTGIWSAVFEKSTVDIGSYEIDFTIEFAGNTGQIFIRTNGTAPQTSQDAGSGNEVEVDINELAPSYPVDSGSSQPYFRDNAEWQAIMSAGGVSIADLTHLHNCQEGSGNLAPAVGGLTLTANASPLYGQTFPGWSDIVSVAGDSSTANQRFLNSSGPNASTTDMLILVLMAWWGTSTTVRGIVNGNNGIGSTAASGVPRAQYRAGSAAATPTSYATATPYWMLWLCDNTNNRYCLYSRLEAYESSGYSPTNTTSYGIGGFGLSTFGPVYVARFASIVGAGARISKATAHGVLSALGESMGWSP